MEFFMKKTMIAVAVASVVAAPAFAEVTIGGKVEQIQTKTDGSAWAPSSDVRLKATGSEDLGNGMNAFFKYEFRVDTLNTAATASTTCTITESFNATGSADTDTAACTTTNTSGHTSYDELVGISGSFGTIQLGRFEDFSEAKGMAVADVFQTTGVETSGNLESRQDGGIAYVSPTVNGFTVGLGGYTGVSSASDAFDARDVAVMYSNGPLFVSVSNEDVKDSRDTTVVAAKYAMGDLTLGAVMTDTDYDAAGTASLKDKMIVGTYKMGNNSLAIGWNEDDAGATDTNTTVVELKHAFGKRTSAAIGFKDADGSNSDQTVVSVQHTF